MGFPVGLLTFPRAVWRGGTLGTPPELNCRFFLVAGGASGHSEMSRWLSVSVFSLGVLGLLSDRVEMISREEMQSSDVGGLRFAGM